MTINERYATEIYYLKNYPLNQLIDERAFELTHPPYVEDENASIKGSRKASKPVEEQIVKVESDYLYRQLTYANNAIAELLVTYDKAVVEMVKHRFMSSEPWTVEKIAQHHHMSRVNVYRKFEAFLQELHEKLVRMLHF